jgi:hypothetical protein
LSTSAPMAITAPSILAPKDRGFPFNSISKSIPTADVKNQRENAKRLCEGKKSAYK